MRKNNHKYRIHLYIDNEISQTLKTSIIPKITGDFLMYKLDGDIWYINISKIEDIEIESGFL